MVPPTIMEEITCTVMCPPHKTHLKTTSCMVEEAWLSIITVEKQTGASTTLSTRLPLWSPCTGGCGKYADIRPQEYENARNIYLLENMDDFVFSKSSYRYYNMPPDFHHNIYWSMVPGDEELPKFPYLPEPQSEYQNWYEWQATGNDSQSLWQDPLFEDPAAHRYILTPDSPAWNLGIQQIDLDNFGIQAEGKYFGRH